MPKWLASGKALVFAQVVLVGFAKECSAFPKAFCLAFAQVSW